MMFLNRFLEDPDKKDGVQNLRVLNMKIFFLLLLTLFNVFLMDQDLTRKKSSVLNPGFFPVRLHRIGFETLNLKGIFVEFFWFSEQYG